MSVPLLHAWQDWVCPNCPVTQRLRPLPANAARFHVCAGLHGLTAPLVLAGTDCKVIAEERDDYLGHDAVDRGDDGKPYAVVKTIRADGSNDALVFAPVARMVG